jgi:phosphoglycerate dehydrogenase-like enzyme
MPTTTPPSSRPTVTVFSSIPGIAQSLRDADPNLPLQIVQDEAALCGYGGTVEFNPSALSNETKSILQQAEILISEPAVVSSLLDYDRFALSSLKWCQSTYAGVDPLFKSSFFSSSQSTIPWKLTRFAGCFGPPIAEWCLSRIIEHERNFSATANDQLQKSWAGSRDRVTNYRYLSSMTLTILGCGDIGRCIAKAAKAFGMKTVGYVRTKDSRTTADDNEEAAAGGVDEYTTDLTRALQSGDYIVSVLPSTPETRGLLSNDVLAAASTEKGGSCPVFINVGRGDVIDEESLLSALDKEYISGAILDVFIEEPLPTNSELWSRSNVIVSPHVSGLTQSSDVPKVFLSNYQRYVENDCTTTELKFLVDWKKGY